jgi:hypothetical protein
MRSTTASLNRSASKSLSLASRSCEARLDALDDAALELGEDAEHLEHRLPGWCAGVDTLLMEVKIDSLGADFGIGLATKSRRLTLGMVTDATGLAPKLIPALKPINSA